ncbi:amidohydrolase family protein [Microbacterium sp. LMI1-1-1.1]|uniref:amidohydrolase family protein n=1 Tax=Microbacterium sp. LMI1-1-1.1 TaxID=3135223 RepID=UPI003465254F
MTFVHCNHLSDEELDLIAAAGGTVSLGIQCEMNSRGIGPIPLFRLLERGMRLSLSGDTETKCTGDMFTQMRMLWAFYRSQLTQMGLERAATMPVMTLRDILGYATLDGAHAVGMGDEIGSLTPGKRADITLIDRNAMNFAPMQDPVASLVLAAHEGNVHDVLVGGEFVKRDGRMVHLNPAELVSRARESQHDLLERASRNRSNGAAQ